MFSEVAKLPIFRSMAKLNVTWHSSPFPARAALVSPGKLREYRAQCPADGLFSLSGTQLATGKYGGSKRERLAARQCLG